MKWIICHVFSVAICVAGTLRFAFADEACVSSLEFTGDSALTLSYNYKSANRGLTTKTCTLKNPSTSLCFPTSIEQDGNNLTVTFSRKLNEDFLNYVRGHEDVNCQLIDDLGGTQKMTLVGRGLKLIGKVERIIRPPIVVPPPIVVGPIPRVDTAMAQRIVNAAAAWAGHYFNPDYDAQCAVFVRAVLAKACNSRFATYHSNAIQTFRPWDIALVGPGEMGPTFANSLAGPEIGTRIARLSDMRPGDLIFFENTYGNWAEGTITHVGIYTGNSMMIDRAGRRETIRQRPISTSLFSGGIRIHNSLCGGN